MRRTTIRRPHVANRADCVSNHPAVRTAWAPGEVNARELEQLGLPVERADRLARDLMVSEVLLAEFRKLNVTVIAADSGTDLTAGDDDPTRVLIRQVLGAVAQFEKSVIVSKLKAARMRKRRETGRCEGRKPFGTRPGEAETVHLIRRLRRKPRGGERLSFAAIAAQLNAEGAATRTGKPWAPETVRQIVTRGVRPS
jgi:DNA invertase Pin-like site-specific DNA recombinase